MAKTKLKLMIIDGNALIHRSFHALPPTMRTKSGQITNAVYGFISFFIKAMKELKPKYVVLTLDKKGRTFRHKKYKDYKATRIKAPDELYAQIPMVKNLAKSFNIPVFSLRGYEADDLIGTIVKKVDGEVEKIILTGDMDTLQLVNSHTKVYMMSRGLNDSILYDKERVVQRFGLNPGQIVDYKALRGDPSDNIPGVPGIGEKTAIKLLREFDSLENLYTHLQEKSKQTKNIKPRIFTLLTKYKKQAFLSKELATIKCDVPVDFNLTDTIFADLDKNKAIAALSHLEFKSLLPRVQALFNSSLNIDKKARQIIAENKFDRNQKLFNYVLINQDRDFNKFLSELKKRKNFTFDTETSSFDPLTADLLGISFSWQKGRAYYLDLRIKNNQKSKPIDLFNYQKKNSDKFTNNKGLHPWLKKLKPIFNDQKVKKYAHNAKFDIKVMTAQGVTTKGIDFDTMIASYLLNPGSRQHGLDAVVFGELGFEKISKDDLLGTGRDKKKFDEVKVEKLFLYSCEDADFTNRLVKKLRPRLKKQKIDKLFKKMEMPLVAVLAKMETTGVKLDKVFLAQMGKKMKTKIISLEKKIYQLAGEEFNIKSTKQLQVILFEKLKIDTRNIKKTKTGISTAAEELTKLQDLHPIIKFIQEYRELTKLTSTYIDALPKLINSRTNRLHTSFKQTVTATGRLSSTDPNLQNIPIRTSLGRDIRKAFIASAGHKLLSLDYSQIELRLAAHMSNDKKMVKAFKKNTDIHTATAAEINQVNPEEVSAEMRREAKAINFGILYGQGPHGLSITAGIPYWQAKEFIDNYFSVYGGIKKYIDTCIKEARQKGYTETLFGRRRYLPEINSSVPLVRKAAERMAVNTPLQGTAADIIKAAMIEINKQIKDKYVHMILQVHDELVFEVKETVLLATAAKIKKIMENIVKLRIPIIVDAKAGKNWGEMKELKKI